MLKVDRLEELKNKIEVVEVKMDRLLVGGFALLSTAQKEYNRLEDQLRELEEEKKELILD
jgi:hypothetical protein